MFQLPSSMTGRQYSGHTLHCKTVEAHVLFYLNLWNPVRWQMFLSKLEFWNPLFPVCMDVSCTVYASRKADFTPVASREACLPQMIQFPSKVSNMIIFSKICLVKGECAFRQLGFLACVRSAFPESREVPRHIFLQERKDLFSLQFIK